MFNINFFLAKKICVIIISIFSVLFFLTTVIGVYKNYSAVPFWDMWNGYLDFYFRTASEGWSPWWELHNEHRLVLAKIFFWIDLEFFKGTMIILFVLNLVFSALECITFIVILKGLVENHENKLLYIAISGVITILCFSWLQQENYTWAFQSQFHMAYLLPLLSILTLVKSKVENSNFLFLLACILSVFSAVTMANGLLALPIMISLAIFIRMNLKYILTLLIIMLCVYFIYFIDYTRPVGHPSLLAILIGNPKAVLRYFLLYLSGPFYGLYEFSPKLSMAMGGFFILGCLWVFKYAIFLRMNNDEKYLKLSGLLAFLVFIGGTALLTSLGRAEYSSNIPSRYMTPAILSWCCLLVIFSAIYYRNVKNNFFVFAALILFPLILLPIQEKALATPKHLHEHKIAAVAAALGVHDKKIIDRVYFDMDRLFRIIEPARNQQVSIFNAKYIRDMYYFGDKFDLNSNKKCNIYIDKVEVIAESPDHLRVLGWAFDKNIRKVPDSIIFVDNTSLVVGFALTGSTRDDVAKVIDPLALNSGFLGYILSDFNLDNGGHIYGVSDEFVCEL
ncbi:MAG: hypothetical protein PHE19_08215 [Candidatus Cloacimonetes bacterium]|nr:hypothetical protein [Candidatus Cloacimonadota bacterium]